MRALVMGITILCAAAKCHSDQPYSDYIEELTKRCEYLTSGKRVTDIEEFTDIKVPYMDTCPELFDGVTCPTGGEIPDRFRIQEDRTNDRNWKLSTAGGLLICCRPFFETCYPEEVRHVCSYDYSFGDRPWNAFPDPHECPGQSESYTCHVYLHTGDWTMTGISEDIYRNLEIRGCED